MGHTVFVNGLPAEGFRIRKSGRPVTPAAKALPDRLQVPDAQKTTAAYPLSSNPQPPDPASAPSGQDQTSQT